MRLKRGLSIVVEKRRDIQMYTVPIHRRNRCDKLPTESIKYVADLPWAPAEHRAQVVSPIAFEFQSRADLKVIANEQPADSHDVGLQGELPEYSQRR